MVLLEMIYQVLLVSNIDRFFSSSVWVMLTGSLGSTSNLYLPSNSLQFTFDVILLFKIYLNFIFSIKILEFYLQCVLVSLLIKKNLIQQNGF